MANKRKATFNETVGDRMLKDQRETLKKALLDMKMSDEKKMDELAKKNNMKKDELKFLKMKLEKGM